MKLVGICKPFNPTFNFVVYDDNNILVSDFACTYEDIGDLVTTCALQNHIPKVVLVGPKRYTEGIKDLIKTVEASKYQQQVLEIELI